MRTKQLFIPLMFLMSLGAASCNEDCCSFGVNKVCDVNEPECAGYTTWEECKTYLESINYNCN